MQPTNGKVYLDLMQNTALVDNERDKKVTYVCGLFIAKTIQPHDIISFVNCYMPVIPYSETFKKIELLRQGNEEVEVVTTKIMISLQCSFSCTKLRVPVKGQWCSHYDCFDLENYLGMNAITQKLRNWTCPLERKDKPMILRRDEFLT